MKHFSNFARGTVIATALLGGVSLASAQVASTMPALYNSNGAEVNASNAVALPAGTYYLGPSTSYDTVYYYGNGVYYDPATGTYGGSTSDSYGTAGANLGYTTTGTIATAPNTGVGGSLVYDNWIVLAISSLVVCAGLIGTPALFRNSSPKYSGVAA